MIDASDGAPCFSFGFLPEGFERSGGIVFERLLAFLMLGILQYPHPTYLNNYLSIASLESTTIYKDFSKNGSTFLAALPMLAQETSTSSAHQPSLVDLPPEILASIVDYYAFRVEEEWKDLAHHTTATHVHKALMTLALAHSKLFRACAPHLWEVSEVVIACLSDKRIQL